MFRRSSIAWSKIIKKRKTILIPWKELESFKRWEPKGPPLPPTCSHSCSKFGCSSLDLAEVESFHRKFYFTRNRASQDAFILRHCQGRSPLRKSSLAVVRKRTITADYFVAAKGSKVQVCKTAFLGILRVQRSRVDTAVKISKCQGNQVASFQSSLSLQRPNVRTSRMSTIHKRKSTRQSIFSRFVPGPKSKAGDLESSGSKEVEIHLYKTKKIISRRSTMKKQSYKQRRNTNISTKVDNSPENLSNVEEVEELRVSNAEIHHHLPDEGHNCVDIVKSGSTSGEKVEENQSVNLIELKEHFPNASPIIASEEHVQPKSPRGEICRRIDDTEPFDWLSPSLKPQRSRTFDWSPLKRPLLRQDVVPEVKGTSHLIKILPEKQPHGCLVYESKKRKMTKLQRTVQDKENFTLGKSKLKKNGIPILDKKNLEKNSLLKKTGIKIEPKTRLPLQTLQYLKNQKFTKG